MHSSPGRNLAHSIEELLIIIRSGIGAAKASPDRISSDVARIDPNLIGFIHVDIGYWLKLFSGRRTEYFRPTYPVALLPLGR
jgi:hypothetical protein